MTKQLFLTLSSLAGVVFTLSTSAGPQVDSWLTTCAGRYARVYTNEAARAAGRASTMWQNLSGSQVQALPAYGGVQAIYSSPNWVYIRSTGLASSYVMGPWLNTPPFPNVPINQHSLWRFPLTPTVPGVKTSSPVGTIGYFVDGVAMFNSWSAYYWNGTTDVRGGPGGFWNADAYLTEGHTFDPGLGHPNAFGTQHYHANPVAERYVLGDGVDYDPVTKTYREVGSTKHSPILGWVSDGFPIYGPYGYADPTNPARGVRRMISGYVLRNGSYGTDDLSQPPVGPATTQRTTRPLWATRLASPCVGAGPGCLPPAAVNGPPVDPTNHVLGYYMEDYAYLGDLGFKQGVDFDLDEFNGRWCVTPEFPGGTYAYFVAIDTNGTPVFPYNIGRAYYGEPVGGEVAAFTEPVTTEFLGEVNLPIVLDTPRVDSGDVTLTWSAVEGGHYQVESTTDFSTWTVKATNVPAEVTRGSYTDTMSDTNQSYRVERGTFDIFDPVLEVVAPGGTASRGTTVYTTITLPSTPPSGSVLAEVRLATGIVGMGISYPGSGDKVYAWFAVPPDMKTGPADIFVNFFFGPSYDLTGGLTIN